MAKIKSTFERYEKKYLLSERKYYALFEKLDGKIERDDYGKVTICNIYFDTPDYCLIRYSLDKPIYKEKLRIRSYGIPNSESMVFVELKKKFEEVVYKRRENMLISEAESYLYDGIAPLHKSQVLKEIDWFINYYKMIRPSMYISYEREAMQGIEDSEIRITFDKNIFWRDFELDLKEGAWGNKIIPETHHLMEIKIVGGMPFWLCDALNSLEIYPLSFSKYGMAYKIQQSKLNEINRNTTIAC